MTFLVGFTLFEGTFGSAQTRLVYAENFIAAIEKIEDYYRQIEQAESKAFQCSEFKDLTIL